MIHDFARALCSSGISLKHADSQLRHVIRQYYPATQTMLSAKQLRRKCLGEVFHSYKHLLTRKVKNVNISIIADDSPDLLGVSTLNTLSCYYDVDKKDKVMGDVSCGRVSLKTWNSLTVGTTVTSVPTEYGESWNDVTAVAGDSTEHTQKMVHEIREGEAMNTIHVKDLPHLIHVTADKTGTLLSSCS